MNFKTLCALFGFLTVTRIGSESSLMVRADHVQAPI